MLYAWFGELGLSRDPLDWFVVFAIAAAVVASSRADQTRYARLP